MAVLFRRDDHHGSDPSSGAAGARLGLTPAAEPDGAVRDGAWVVELAGDVLKGWPKGMRLIVRKVRPHPGTQLRFTDATPTGCG